ncbi:MAG: CHAD domain-containing protein, partial [Pyrinomonadaceae bacterium]
DQDVAIKRLEKLAEEAEENVAAGVRQLIEGREQQRAGARLKLEKALRDERLRKLSDKLGAKIARAIGLVEGDKEDDSSRPARPEFVSELTFIEAGREMVGARFEELADTADSLFRPQAIEEIHRTRIRAKRARYAVELFASCRGDALQPFALEIEGLQKSLGELHDLDVWIEELGERLAKLHGRAGKSAPGDESLRAALVWLLARFAVERAEHYSDALTLWHEWQTTDFAGRLMSAFDEKPQGEDAPS